MSDYFFGELLEKFLKQLPEIFVLNFIDEIPDVFLKKLPDNFKRYFLKNCLIYADFIKTFFKEKNL